jgi:predicted SnoaL-like aldol condensation-catalyzing enzyme
MQNKDIAQSFLRMASSGKAQDAFEAFTAPDFRHHNPGFAGDAHTLAQAMDADTAAAPKQLTILRAIEEGELVALHMKVQRGANLVSVMHLYRFVGDKIAELWDVGLPAPPSSPNVNGLF